MADYRAARAAIAATLGTVAITSPISLSIARVYETRPDAGEGLQDWPCILITGAAIDRWSRSAGLRERVYRVGLRLGVRSSGQGESMQDVVQAFREAIGAKFDADLALGTSGFHVSDGPIWPAIEVQVDGGAVWDDGEMLIEAVDDGAFAG